MSRIIRSHHASYINMRSSFTITLFSDIFAQDLVNSYTLNEMYEACFHHDELTTRYLDYVCADYLQSFRINTTPIEIARIIASRYPKLSNCLRLFQCINPNLPLTDREYILQQELRSYDGPYTSLARIGFSYGNNALLFYYLLAFALGNRSREYQIFKLPDELSTFPNLPEIVSQKFPTVKSYYCLTHAFTGDDVRNCSFLLGNGFLRKNTLEYLNVNTGAGYIHNRSSGTNRKYPDDLSPDLLTKASRVIINKLHLGDEDLIRKYIGGIPFDFFNRRVVLIGNRDTAYVGSGQEWRNSTIELYEPSIAYLLSQGFSIIRINTIAHPLSIADPYLIDLANFPNLDNLIQLHLLSFGCLLIGTATGAVGFAQILTSCPTLNIDSACIFGHEPFSHHMSSPKRILICNNSQLTITEFVNILTPTKAQTWTDDLCSEYNIRLIGLTKEVVTKDVIEFVNTSLRNNWHTVPRLSWVIDKELLPYDHMISTSYYLHLLGQSLYLSK